MPTEHQCRQHRQASLRPANHTNNTTTSIAAMRKHRLFATLKYFIKFVRYSSTQRYTTPKYCHIAKVSTPCSTEIYQMWQYSSLATHVQHNTKVLPHCKSINSLRYWNILDEAILIASNAYTTQHQNIATLQNINCLQ